MKKIIVITGQTASGKTKLALQLAREHNGELINADSRQIYKELDIVTGKDINHGTFYKESSLGDFDLGYYKVEEGGFSTKVWLYDIIKPSQAFSASDFVSCVLPVIQRIWAEGKTPIIIGGTYYYIAQLLYSFPDTGIGADWELRKSLEGKPVEELQALVKRASVEVFESMNNSDRNNPHRLIRRLELLQATDGDFTPEEPFTYELDLDKKLGLDEKLEYDIRGLRYESREALQEAISKRIHSRLAGGAVQETRDLLEKGYTVDMPGMKSIGYPQIADLIQNLITEKELITIWQEKEMQYAKRQTTFMKRDPHISWVFSS